MPVDDDGNFNPPKRVRLQFLHKALENPFQYAKDKEMRHNLIVLFTGLIPFLTGNQARINEEIMRIFGISEFVPVAIKASTLRALAKSWDPENDY